MTHYEEIWYVISNNEHDTTNTHSWRSLWTTVNQTHSQSCEEQKVAMSQKYQQQRVKKPILYNTTNEVSS